MAPPRRRSSDPWHLTARLVGWVLLAGTGVAFFSPFLWMVLSAMKSSTRIFSEPWSLPETITLKPFFEAYRAGNLQVYFGNSLVVTVASVAATVLLAALAGYALARWRFRGQDLILALFLVGLILPIQAYLVPLRWLIDWLGLFDTRLALILPYTAISLPMAIYILRAFFLSLPRELGESAAIDGASPLGTFFHIYLPLAAPAAASVAVITALFAWNEFLLGFLFIQDDALRTVPAGLLIFQGEHTTDYRLLFAGLTLVSLPLILVYLVAQRYMIEGLTAGALKE